MRAFLKNFFSLFSQLQANKEIRSLSRVWIFLFILFLIAEFYFAQSLGPSLQQLLAWVQNSTVSIWPIFAAAGAFVLRILFQALHGFSLTRVHAAWTMLMQRQVMEKLYALDYQDFQKQASHQWIFLLQNQIGDFVDYLIETLFLISNLCFIAIFTGLIFSWSVPYGFSVLAALGIMGLIQLGLKKPIVAIAEKRLASAKDSFRWIEELIQQYKPLRVSKSLPAFLQQHDRLKSQFVKHSSRLAFFQHFNPGVGEFVFLTGIAIVTGLMLRYQLLSAAVLTSGVYVMYRLQSKLSGTLASLIHLQQLQASVADLFRLLQTSSTAQTTATDEKISRELEFHFKFKNSQDFSLYLPKFKLPTQGIIGLQGPNGSGKSTFLNLLCGLYSPSSNHPISLNRDPIAWIGSETSFFNHSLLWNLSLGNDFSTARCQELLEGFGLTKRLGHSPTDLVKANLSQGELKKIEIVRALLQTPSALFIDEGLENLDANSLDYFFTDLSKNLPRCLVVIATHQTEILRRCTEVIYFNQGVGSQSPAPLKKVELL